MAIRILQLLHLRNPFIRILLQLPLIRIPLTITPILRTTMDMLMDLMAREENVITMKMRTEMITLLHQEAVTT